MKWCGEEASFVSKARRLSISFVCTLETRLVSRSANLKKGNVFKEFVLRKKDCLIK